MSASWNNPALVNKISDDVPAIKSLLIALLKMTDANTEDVPVDAKRLQEVTGGVQFQNYTGSTWANVGKLMHDVDMLDGKHASSSATADTIPVRDANGRLAGDILGNANTATTASSVAAGYVVPVANGGTGASDEAGARTNLGTNNAANITTGVLAIERGGTGSGTKNFVDLSTAQTIGGNKTFSGEVLLNKNVLKMTVLDTLEGATDERTDTLIQGISPNADGGITALFGASGNAVFGAGEGKDSLLAELAGNADEDAYIIADGNIVFHPGADVYADRKTVTLNAAGELSGLAKVTATAFAGNLTGDVTGNCSGSSGSCTGNAATATKLATARTINIQDSSATNTGTGASFDGSGNATIKLPATIKASITGNCSGSSGSCTGNAASATKLATARKIDNASFNGTADVVVVPIGAVLYFAAKTAPAKYLVCNGQAVSRTTYSALFAVIGTTYGKGNGSSTFNVPNLIDRFPQGNATPGTVKAAGLPNITGTFGWSSGDGFVDIASGCFSGVAGTTGRNCEMWNANNKIKAKVNFAAKSSNSIYGNSSTVQPPALTLLPIIKAL